MARKNEVFEKNVEAVNEVAPPEPEQAKPPAADEPRVWVYLGPSIRGAVTNGRIFAGSKADAVSSLGGAVEQYPQIERLIVADRDIAKAKNDLKEKRGIYIPYAALIKKITGKED